ncbi:hypothetical protein BX600DRAFT_501968 [Xylariales sp. PMI_506]|nr:hypothetical protein BX600DRAFT_501968 [Xylariales sp. PMI_506]
MVIAGTYVPPTLDWSTTDSMVLAFGVSGQITIQNYSDFSSGRLDNSTGDILLQDFTYSNGEWLADPPMLAQETADIDTQFTPHLAMTMLNNFTDTYYIIQYKNGTLAGWIEGQHNQTIKLIDSSSGPTISDPFDAIATTVNGSFYVIHNDTILAYKFNNTDLFILDYHGRVYPIEN